MPGPFNAILAIEPYKITGRTLPNMKLIYTGSVKNIYQADDPGLLWFEYTDDFSVFDWGKMPDPIPGKGEALARLGEWFFERLSDSEQWKALGLKDEAEVGRWLPMVHHFVKREGNRLLVNKVDIPGLKADSVGGNLVYDYGFPPQPRQLIPLEVLFRFGVPAGSSLLQRKDWYPFDIHEGAEFDQPLIEFSTKLETKDRVISYQEAALILTNIDSVPGRGIVQHFGLVQGSTIRAKHLGRDFAASLKNIVGGELKGYTELLQESRAEATDRMVAQAQELGANAVINVRFTTSSVAQGASEILAYGTAVLVE